MLFTTTLNSAESQFDDLMALVNWQDKVRETLTAPVGVETPIALDRPIIDLLASTLPPKKFWQTYDHCAAVGRGYSIFEDAVEKLVREYLEILTKITPSYTSLIDAVRTQHRVGIAHVMGKWGDEKSLYSSLKEVDLAGGLVDGLRGSSYGILAEAFLTDSDNYRWDTLDRIFRKIGFDGALASISENAEVQEFQRAQLGGESISGRLNSFVKLRNEAAHGSVDTVLSANELHTSLRLLSVLLSAFAGLLRWDLTQKALPYKAAVHLGTLVKRYSNEVFGARGTDVGIVRPGDKILVGKKALRYVEIVTLQIKDAAVNQINIDKDFEFGVRLAANTSEGSEIYIWK
jgi:hypothetical protein